MTPHKPNINPAGRYTISETSSLLGVNRRTVMRWRDNGTIRQLLHGVKSGRVYFQGAEIIKAWINH